MSSTSSTFLEWKAQRDNTKENIKTLIDELYNDRSKHNLSNMKVLSHLYTLKFNKIVTMNSYTAFVEDYLIEAQSKFNFYNNQN